MGELSHLAPGQLNQTFTYLAILPVLWGYLLLLLVCILTLVRVLLAVRPQMLET